MGRLTAPRYPRPGFARPLCQHFENKSEVQTDRTQRSFSQSLCFRQWLAIRYECHRHPGRVPCNSEMRVFPQRDRLNRTTRAESASTSRPCSTLWEPPISRPISRRTMISPVIIALKITEAEWDSPPEVRERPFFRCMTPSLRPWGISCTTLRASSCSAALHCSLCSWCIAA
jgi:hypothetical protein